MTFIAMISMQDCVVLAADREEFSVFSNGQSVSSGATARKITKLSDAYVTASGWKDLINPVKERLAEEESFDIDRAKSIIQEEQGLFRSRSPVLAEEWTPKSSWKMSIPWGDGVVAAFYDYSAESFRGVEPGVAIFTYPSGVTEAEKRHVESHFAKGRFIEANEEEITKVIEQVLGAVCYLRSLGRPVSREIDFAVHRVSGRAEFERQAFA